MIIYQVINLTHIPHTPKPQPLQEPRPTLLPFDGGPSHPSTEGFASAADLAFDQAVRNWLLRGSNVKLNPIRNLNT